MRRSLLLAPLAALLLIGAWGGTHHPGGAPAAAAATQDQRSETGSLAASLDDHDDRDDHDRGEERQGRESRREGQRRDPSGASTPVGPDRAALEQSTDDTTPGDSLAPPSPPSVAAATTGPSMRPDGDHTFWYLARAAGLTAYLMLFANVFLGMAVHLRQLDGLLARWRSFDLHQFTALVAAGFMLLHALALLGDSYVEFTPAHLLVPFASPYRPAWTALGVVALYLLLAVLVSSYLRRFIGHRTWRAIHYLSFAAFLLATAHGILAGTDSAEPWAVSLYGAAGAVTLLLLALRFRRTAGHPPARQPANAHALKSDEAGAAG